MIDNREQLNQSTSHAVALEALTAGIEAADPTRLTRERVGIDGETLRIGDETISLTEFKQIRVIGGGKAAGVVAAELEGILGERLDGGVVVTNNPVETDRIEVLAGDHPVPSQHGVDSTRRLLTVAEDAGAETLLVAVITGGGSALMTAPAEGITLSELQSTTQSLLESGASIDEINAVRKHCSALKGGQLAATAAPARVCGLVLSDVVGNDLSTIASGPFVADPSTFAEARAVVERYELQVPDGLQQRLQAGVDGEVAETPKSGDPVFEHVSTTLLGDSMVAVQAAAKAAKQEGFEPLVLSSRIRGDSQAAATTQAAVAEEVLSTGNPLSPPAVVVSGGETTVTVEGAGTGGPNQEFAVAGGLAVEAGEVVVAAVDTDGIDGPTDAAGGIVDGSVDSERAESALAEHDSYPFLESVDGLVRTGPTGTNVNDLRVVVVPADGDE